MRKLSGLVMMAMLVLVMALAAIGCGQQAEDTSTTTTTETMPPMESPMDTSMLVDTTMMDTTMHQ